MARLPQWVLTSMFRSVRAAGFAAAAFSFAALSFWSDPVLAVPIASPAVAAFQNIISGGEASAPDAPVSALPPGSVSGLAGLIAAHPSVDPVGAEQNCLVNAIYFESRGEPLEGQLAVAEVVINRARSGRYPTTLCGVVKQPAQFSFVRRGAFPRADRDSEAWRRAVAIAHIAQTRAARLLPDNVLWYHANYVSPSWGRRLARNTRIGLHIFYS
jgi:hypothetical protein